MLSKLEVLDLVHNLLRITLKINAVNLHIVKIINIHITNFKNAIVPLLCEKTLNFEQNLLWYLRFTTCCTADHSVGEDGVLGSKALRVLEGSLNKDGGSNRDNIWNVLGGWGGGTVLWNIRVAKIVWTAVSFYFRSCDFQYYEK